MRIPDEFLKCVSFLGVETPQGFEAMGTAFIVTVESEAMPQRFYPYLVTAKHCLVNAAGRPLILRMNTKAGGSHLVRINSDSGWMFSEDPSADVVTIPIFPSADVFEISHINSGMFVTPQTTIEHGIGIGDDIYMVGLFSKRKGAQRNLPIVRTGIIAAMPSEPLTDTRTGLSYNAYIAEVRSIGGLSGSPVFVMLNPGRVGPDNKVNFSRKGFLLGLVRGHWDYDNNQTLINNDTDGKINMGMAAITPIEELMKILNHPDTVQTRRRQDREFAQTTEITEDSAGANANESDSSKPDFTKDDFENALKKVSRKLSDEERSET